VYMKYGSTVLRDPLL